ncbi:MAG: hypothetical protein ACTHU0_27115 [Kofleriaceae bacterium]
MANTTIGSRVKLWTRELGRLTGFTSDGWYLVVIDGETVEHAWQPHQVMVHVERVQPGVTFAHSNNEAISVTCKAIEAGFDVRRFRSSEHEVALGLGVIKLVVSERAARGEGAGL